MSMGRLLHYQNDERSLITLVFAHYHHRPSPSHALIPSSQSRLLLSLRFDARRRHIAGTTPPLSFKYHEGGRSYRYRIIRLIEPHR